MAHLFASLGISFHIHVGHMANVRYSQDTIVMRHSPDGFPTLSSMKLGTTQAYRHGLEVSQNLSDLMDGRQLVIQHAVKPVL